MRDDVIELLEYTGRNIFLTGKAGTGKTTLLNDFVKITQKKYILLAPTGIAAIQAGGVTIHSMFGLPLKSFVPTREKINQNDAINIPELGPYLYFRKEKINLLQQVEMCIIDEVSMLRADVLDMVDIALRKARQIPEPFGGVQMVFIGDLYQLPPVVRNEGILSGHYESPFFFDAHSFKDSDTLVVELERVYRQSDPEFINLLNAVRYAQTEKIDWDRLNSRVVSEKKKKGNKKKQAICLTSHNAQADSINQKNLNALPSKIKTFEAFIEGDFRESNYPNPKTLQLKEGARVMFIRNRSDALYYNGSIGTVKRIEPEKIWVELDSKPYEEIEVGREVWEHKKYGLNPDNTIKEEVIGSYRHFPLRLAWAVTIHKSQGLTFDSVHIDAAKSFASGQVYVALSRCRTLDGIELESPIPPSAIRTDGRLIRFQSRALKVQQIRRVIREEKYPFATKKVMQHLNLYFCHNTFLEWRRKVNAANIHLDTLPIMLRQANETYQELQGYYQKFRIQINNLLKRIIQEEIEWGVIRDRLRAATIFFFNEVKNKILIPIQEQRIELKDAKANKQFQKITQAYEDDIKVWLKRLVTTKVLKEYLVKKNELDTSLLDNIQLPTKNIKIPSHILTEQFYKNGYSPQEIAQKRNLAISTVYGHLDKIAQAGRVNLDDFFSKKIQANFENLYKKNGKMGLNEWKEILPPELSYSEIRLLLSHFNFIEKQNEK